MIKEEVIRDIQRKEEIEKMRQRDLARLVQIAKFVEVTCPACSSERHKFVFQKGGFKFAECTLCKTLFVNPRPSEKDLEWYYTKAEVPREFAKVIKSKEKERVKLIYTPRAKYIVATIEKYLTGIKDISLVEIGGGTGGFLELLKRIRPQWHYIIIEPGGVNVNFLRERGLEVIDDMVENADKSRMQNANAILNFELIEHLFNPAKFTQNIYNILQQGGLFILTTPNRYGFDFWAIGEEYKNIMAPNHLNYFNPNSIEILLRQTGNRFLDFLLYETNDIVLSEFQEFLRSNRLSGHMMVVARRS